MALRGGGEELQYERLHTQNFKPTNFSRAPNNMRFSTFTTAVIAAAGVGECIQTATPIRIIVSSERFDLNGERPSFAGIQGLPKAVPVGQAHHIQHVQTGRMRVGCAGARMNRFRQKGIEISNAFRKALGWPLIAEPSIVHVPPMESKPGEIPKGMVQIMPFIGTPQPTIKVVEWTGNKDASVHRLPPNHVHHHHPHGHRFHHGVPPFAVRLHHSLMNLGRWEGRAVAFVLGCGIGVLLRMFWVLAVVFYRAVKGSKAEEHEYTHIIIDAGDVDDETVVHSPPPTYTYPVDEKIAVEADAPKAAAESK
ncbi:hypothetical protein CPC08DRAFT_28275 [Agrocybe pediades]|nr:hypothetical protein CPC08DRAFT_28275 [Agrocybe pediades]